MKLTQSAIKGMKYEKVDNKADLHFDDELRGFGVRVYPSKRKSFFITYRNATGTKKRINIGEYGKLTVHEARNLARKKLAKTLDGHDPAEERRTRRNEITVDEFAEQFLEDAQHRKKSIKDDRQRLRDHILPALKAKKLSEVKLADLTSLHITIKKKTSPSTANRCAALIKKMLNDAVKFGLLDKSPAQHLKLFPEPSPRDTRLSEDECIRFISACNDDENPFTRALFLLAMFTGRRMGELQNSHWEDLNLYRRTLLIRDTKVGEPQTVVLNDQSIDVLRSTPRVDGNPYIVAGNKPGQPIVHYRRAWDRIIKRAGIKPFPPHGLRHNFVSGLVSMGISNPVIMKLVGHKSYLTTLKYAHHRDDELYEATSAFSAGIINFEEHRPKRDAS